MHATAERKTLTKQTPLPAAGAVVVTACYGPRRYETRIEGGQLDGWTKEAATEAQALYDHAGMVALARGTAA
jgi:hypothetical protein